MCLDLNFTEAELYLGETYGRRYSATLGVKKPDNQDYPEKALQYFMDVLKKEPNNTRALAGLASMYQIAQGPKKARGIYLRLTQLEPLQPVWFYAVASIDWIIAFDRWNPLPPNENADIIEDGLRNVDVALALSPNYEDAMTYKNLLFREKATMAADSAEKSRLTAEADDWFNKALKTHRTNQNNAVVGGPHSDFDPIFAVPPPPPPPPPPPAPPGRQGKVIGEPQ